MTREGEEKHGEGRQAKEKKKRVRRNGIGVIKRVRKRKINTKMGWRREDV